MISTICRTDPKILQWYQADMTARELFWLWERIAVASANEAWSVWEAGNRRGR